MTTTRLELVVTDTQVLNDLTGAVLLSRYRGPVVQMMPRRRFAELACGLIFGREGRCIVRVVVCESMWRDIIAATRGVWGPGALCRGWTTQLGEPTRTLGRRWCCWDSADGTDTDALVYRVADRETSTPRVFARLRPSTWRLS